MAESHGGLSALSDNSKTNGHTSETDPGLLAHAMLDVDAKTSKRRASKVKRPDTRTFSILETLKRHGSAIATGSVIFALVLNLFFVGRWTGKIETKQDAQAASMAETAGAVKTLDDDFRKLTLDRVEDARQQSYIRAQNEVLGKQLAAIQATLDAQRRLTP